MSEKRFVIKSTATELELYDDDVQIGKFPHFEWVAKSVDSVVDLLNEQQEEITYWKHRVSSLLWILGQFDEQKVKKLLEELDDNHIPRVADLLDELQTKCHRLEKENDNCKNDYRDLFSNYVALEEKNKKYIVMMNANAQLIEKLAKENDMLKNDNEKLQEDRDWAMNLKIEALKGCEPR